LIGGHGTVGQDEACQTGRGQVVDKVLHPREVGVSGWRDAELPSFVVFEALATPVAVVEGRIGQDIVSLEIGVQIAVKAVGVFLAEVPVDAANSQVYLC